MSYVKHVYWMEAHMSLGITQYTSAGNSISTCHTELKRTVRTGPKMKSKHRLGQVHACRRTLEILRCQWKDGELKEK
jgi:hypothetical protein